jgi:hypothetical protein
LELFVWRFIKHKRGAGQMRAGSGPALQHICRSLLGDRSSRFTSNKLNAATVSFARLKDAFTACSSRALTARLNALSGGEKSAKSIGRSSLAVCLSKSIAAKETASASFS